MNAQQSDNIETVSRAAALLILLALGAVGCASAPVPNDDDQQQLEIQDPDAVSGYAAVRKVAGISQTAYIYANSFYANPLIRPVTHVTSLSSYVLKSSGGAMRRVAIASAQMPLLEGPIPEVTHAEPMDLVAWEKKLDTITATEQTRGTIEFLVDGDEYFPRLEKAIDDATESIDIRTYIFDNDDFALSIADRIKARSHEVTARRSSCAVNDEVLLHAGLGRKTPENAESLADRRPHQDHDHRSRSRVCGRHEYRPRIPL
jgi:hypothetical protein